MPEVKPLNKPFLGISFVIVVFLAAFALFSPPPPMSPAKALGLSITGTLFFPIMVLWFKALWNNVIPRITGWKEITFWEAIGLSTILVLVIGF